MSLSDFFNKSKRYATEDAQSPTPTLANNPIPEPQFNINEKQEGESYHTWGARVSANAKGSALTLEPFLQRVFIYGKIECKNDEEYQKRENERIQLQIDQKTIEKGQKEAERSQNQDEQKELSKKTDELKAKITGLKDSAYQTNKDEKAKMIIGLTILVPLTIYLFIFYSSTFYSAFFKSGISSGNVWQEMFDPQALSNALNGGINELLFVTLAPVIFLGLGFLLHYFLEEKTWKGWLKTVGIVAVIFAFDTLLAYKIGKMAFTFAQMNTVDSGFDNITYSLSYAAQDNNFWIVIFCGFVSYIIWGLLFDNVMTAYGKLDLNKIHLNDYEEKIEKTEAELKEKKDKWGDLNNKIIELENVIPALERSLKDGYFVNYIKIESIMSQFYGGWVQQMSMIGISEQEQAKCLTVFNTQKTLLLKKENPS